MAVSWPWLLFAFALRLAAAARSEVPAAAVSEPDPEPTPRGRGQEPSPEPDSLFTETRQETLVGKNGRYRFTGDFDFEFFQRVVDERGNHFLSKAVGSTRHEARPESLQQSAENEVAILEFLQAQGLHKNILQLTDVVVSSAGALQFLVFEDAAGRVLEDVAREQSASHAEAQGLFVQLVDGLAHCHRNGIVHGDLTAYHVLVTSEGALKLAHFGAAYHVGQGGAKGSRHVDRLYRAPEYWGSKYARLDGREADVWSAGIILYLLASGRLPFPVNRQTLTLNDSFGKLMMKASIEFEHPELKTPGIDGSVFDTLIWTLEKDPKKRWSVDEIKGAELYQSYVAPFAGKTCCCSSLAGCLWFARGSCPYVARLTVAPYFCAAESRNPIRLMIKGLEKPLPSELCQYGIDRIVTTSCWDLPYFAFSDSQARKS